MSELQIGLIIIGGLIILGVLILNWWQERRFNQQVNHGFSALPQDALLEEYKAPYQEDHAFEVLNRDALDDDRFSIGADLERTYQGEQTDEIREEVTEEISEKASDFVASYANTPNQASASTGWLPEVDEPIAATAEQKLEAAKTEIKTSQHDEIKAIFNEAFTQTVIGERDTASNSAVINALANNTAEIAPVLEEKPENTAPDLPAILHPQIDLSAVLYFASELPANKIQQAIQNQFDDYDKPVFIHVLNTHQTWQPLEKVANDEQVLRITCSIQLADRSGAASRSTLNRFQLAVDSLGITLDAHVEWQTGGDAYAAATALDAFCIEVDKTMGFHLVHGENGAFTGTKLRGLAEAQGLLLSSDGTFKYFDDSATQPVTAANASQLPAPAFVMFNRDYHPFNPEMLRASVVKAITFQLDIPRVKQCTEAFNHMLLVAKQVETGLHARLVDDNNKPLGDVQIEKIRYQLKIIHAKMLARGIVPGSESALRLFS